MGFGVGGPVGFAELEGPVAAGGDVPVVCVNKPVMKPTEKDQVVQVGGPTLRPVLNVMNLQPFGVSTAGKRAGPPVTVMNQTT